MRIIGAGNAGGGIRAAISVDCYLSADHYWEHVAPIWRALNDARGCLYAGDDPGLRHRIEVDGFEWVPWTGEPADRLTIVASTLDLRQVDAAGRPTVWVEHGAGQRYLSDHPVEAGLSEAHQRCRLHLLPGGITMRLHRERYRDAPAVAVGCPKLDAWPRWRPGRNEQPIVAVSFHWDSQRAPESQWAFPHHILEIVRLAAFKEWRIVGHSHPRIRGIMETFWAQVGIEYWPEFTDVIRRADCYVCDNSSTMFEAAHTGMPVVALNAPWYRRDVEHGLRFWEAAGVGIQVDEPEHLAAGIRRALQQHPVDVAERERCLNMVYRYRDGTATVRAVEAILATAARLQVEL